MKSTVFSGLKVTLLFLLVIQLSGCVYWRLYQTKVQLEEFDRNFSIDTNEGFVLNIKNPLIFSEDLLYLGKMQPTQIQQLGNKQVWTSIFRKVDANNDVIKPEINFFWKMIFNQEQLLTSWALSPSFMRIAPAEFLEVSFRAMAGAEINESKNQVKADLNSVEKISTPLPSRADIVKQLGEPFAIEERKQILLYRYRFLLESPKIEPGYEDRVNTKVKLYFNKKTDKLVKVSGSFAGIKISIDYRKLVANEHS